MMRRVALLCVAMALTACATTAERPSLPPAPPPAAALRAVDAAVSIGDTRRSPITTPDAAPALRAFLASCPALLRREDRSGLTQPGDWTAACAAAATTTDAAAFFSARFTPVLVAGGAGRVTGYFEPEIAGSLKPAPGYAVPLYRRPPDLIEVDLGRFAPDLKGRKVRGRIAGSQLIPYYDRAEIMAGGLAGRGLEIGWAADPYEAFFLEIQGSGRLRTPDGGIVRIGYDGQNGRDYVAIGRLLVDRGRLARGQATMAGILDWLRANPAEAPAILAANPSVVFFRRIEGDGPVGAMGVALTPQISLAADPAFVPLGSPVWVETTLPGDVPLRTLMVAQDTGSAIKGANRLDLFRGAGDTARAEAGALSAPARVVLLLPAAAAQRLAAAAQRPADRAAPPRP